MIKNDEKMIKQYINQYEYDIDYEFDVNSVDDIKDERTKQEIESLYKSIDEYTKEKMKLDNKFDVYNKQIRRGIHHFIFYIFAINIKLNALVMIGRCNNLLQTKTKELISIKIFLHLYFILIIVIYIFNQ
jgi:hypothetical protein